MGAFDDGHYNVVLENRVKLDGCGFEQEQKTLAIEDAVKVLLQGLGEDINREGLKKTPLRVAKAFREGTRGYKQNVKDIVEDALFPEVGVKTGIGHAGGDGGLVLVRDLDLFSYCESCLLPFQVKCHVGYIPSGQRVVGLSKLSRVADIFAKRFQDPQRLADEICSGLQHGINPTGVAVVLHCSHIHFPDYEHESSFLNSNRARWVNVIVTSGSGTFEKPDSVSWVDFIGLLRCRDISLDNICLTATIKDSWCPLLLSPGTTGTGTEIMEIAVASIIQSLGQDPCRKELVGTPKRFLKWLIKFKDSNLQMKHNLFDSMIPLKSVGQMDYEIKSVINLELWSLCEHHLLPFYGVVHIGYISSDDMKPISKSVLQSMVHFHGFRLQVQERVTRQISETVSRLLGGDVIIVVEASHTCMISRGIEKFGSNTATTAVLGRFSHDHAARARFLQMIPHYSL